MYPLLEYTYNDKKSYFTSFMFYFEPYFSCSFGSWFIILFVGFNVETVEYKNISFTVWDVGGQDKVRYNPTFTRITNCPCQIACMVLLIADPSSVETLLPEHSGAYLCC